MERLRPLAKRAGKKFNRRPVTPTSYAVDSLPSYFLVDKRGRVVEGWSAKLPDEEMIRKLLSAAE